MTGISQKKLPDGWKRQALKNILPPTSIKRGHRKVTEDLAVDEGTITLIFSGDLQNKQKIESHRKTTPALLERELGKPFEEIRKETFVLPNSVLVAMARNKAGSVGIHREGDAIMNNAIVAFTPAPGTILPELLFYFFKNTRILQRLRSNYMPGGKTYARQEDIIKLQMNYPVEMEQQTYMVEQIEALLTEAELARVALQKNQQLMNQLLESALRQVFTSERRKKWQSMPLSLLVNPIDETDQPFEPEHEQYPLVEADDIDEAVAEIQIDISTIGLSPSQGEKGFLLAHHPACLLYANTFTPDTRWRSRVAMPFAQRETPYEALRCTDNLFALIIKEPMQETISPRFLFWALQDPLVTTRLTGSDQFKSSVKISRAKLRALAVPVPALDEQERISTYLDTYQEQLSQLQQTRHANQLTVEQLEGRILDQFFREE